MFSKSTEYALRATFYIAKEGTVDRKLSIVEISDAIGSPKHFTAKILQVLAKDNKIVSSVRGPGGGFYMTDASRRLPVIHILEAMDEERTLTGCVLGLTKCSSDRPCPLHRKYELVKVQLLDIFENASIDEVINKMPGEHFFQ